MALEEIRIEGYVGNDAKYGTGKGAEMLSFPVGVTQSVKNKVTEEWEDKTNWYYVEIWDKKRSDFFLPRIKKSEKVVVEGRLVVKPYLDKDGAPKSNVAIIARNIITFTKREKTDSMPTKANQDINRNIIPYVDDEIPF